MSPIKPGIYCTVEWDPDPKHRPTPWYGNIYVRVYNLTPDQIKNPEISFEVKKDLKVQNNYGLVWKPNGNTITGHLVNERQVIKPNGKQSFTLGIERPGDPVPAPSDLLYKFHVNGKPADLPPDVDPPSTPKNLKATHLGPKSVTVAWDPSPELGVSYRVYVDDHVRPDLADSPSYRVGGLKPQTPYHINVQAVNIANKTSDRSKPVTPTTIKPLPPCDDWDIRRAPFVDFTSTPTVKLTSYKKESTVDGFILGFGVVRVEDPSDTTLKWGAYPSLHDTVLQEDVLSDLPHGRWNKDDLSKFTQDGGRFAISFGGASNIPLETHLKDPEKIVSQYEQIMHNYECEHFDFDFEGAFIQDQDALSAHVSAMVILLGRKPKLKISYTLPVDGAPGALEGFNPNGEWLLQLLAGEGIQPSLITGMLMEFGQTSPSDAWECCRIALEGSDGKGGMHKQIKTQWPEWDDAQVWRHIGACPMFGENINGKIFTLDHMRELVEYARKKDIGCVSGWDATRDKIGKQITHTPQHPFDFCKIIATYQSTVV